MEKVLLFMLLVLFACKNEHSNKEQNFEQESAPTFLKNPIQTPSKTNFDYHPDFISDAFDFPVGKPNADGYYNAQGFGKNKHLGDDWNLVTGGNSDLGDPIYSIANGYVKFTDDLKGGWGKVIRILHQLPNGKEIESVYAHCDTIIVESDSWINKGEQIGTIGNAGGLYYAHLHFEIRDNVQMGIGGGYSIDQQGYLDPTKFINDHRVMEK